MDKANAAEWLLRRVVDPSRASELVGDLLESHPDAGRVTFWVSIARLSLRFSWRTVLGVAASPILGLFVAIAFFALSISSQKGTINLPEMTVFHIRSYLLGISVLLWAATAFSLVRLGWRNPLTGVGVTASVLWSATLSCFWQWTPALVLSILWVALLVFCVSSAKRRRALITLCSAVAAAWMTAFALASISHDPNNVFGKWQGITALFLIPLVESTTTLILHEKFVASQHSDS